MQDLERAWKWREERGLLKSQEAVRVFHGPGEGEGALREISIDRFGAGFWITLWDRGADLARVSEFLQSKGAQSGVALDRSQKAEARNESEVLWGEAPEGRFAVREGKAKFLIQLRATRHPGLFLDHEPLRRWLSSARRASSVLNAFAYTGSLSVAAALGGAESVTTLDLSNSTIQWAKQNWAENGLAEERGRFIAGDVFEWLPRLKREGKRFGCVILDPPSFSRGKKGVFSTAKDLSALHSLVWPILEPGGTLLTSINSSNVSFSDFESQIARSAREARVQLERLFKMELPETFPLRPGAPPSDAYLKGLALRLR